MKQRHLTQAPGLFNDFTVDVAVKAIPIAGLKMLLFVGSCRWILGGSAISRRAVTIVPLPYRFTVQNPLKSSF